MKIMFLGHHKHIALLLGTIMLLLLGSMRLTAQRCDYSFAHLGIDDGLNANHVKAIIRSKEGFVWIGTVNGLNRFDGANIRSYTCYDQVKEKGNNNIGALYEADDGVIWIGTDRGVYTYLPESDGISYVDIWDEDTGGLNWVQSIEGDAKGNIWVLVPDQGIFRKTSEGGNRYEMPPGGKYKEDYFNDICITPEGTLWACSSNGKVFRYDKGYDEMVEVKFDLPEKAKFARILPYGDDKLLIADEEARVWILYPEDDYMAKEVKTNLPDDLYLRSVALIDNEIWLGTQSGLFLIDIATGQLHRIAHSLTDRNSLSDNTIYTLYPDAEKNMWIGTVFGGVNYTERDRFHFCTIEPMAPDSRRVRGLALTPQHELIVIGSVSNGISIYNLIDNRFETVPPGLNIKTPIMCVSKSGEKVMVGPDRRGLWVYEPGKTPYQYLPSQLSNENTVYAYLKDSNGNEWVGLSYALFIRKNGEETFERVEETHYQWIFTLLEASDGTIWIGTMGTGLYRYTPSNNKFFYYVYDDSKVSEGSLRSNSINSIMEDKAGRIWISTDRGGLSRYNRETDDFTTFGVAEGLPDDVVYPVMEDSKQRLWFGTNKGLVRMDTSGQHIVVFTKADGLPTNEFTYNSAVCDSDSAMFFGTINGVVRFNPNETSISASEYPVLFTSIDVHSGKADHKDLLSEGNIIYSTELRVPYNCNTFSLTVGVPSAIMLKGSKRYYYRLLPGGEKWIPIQGNRISFTNLAPSKYTLEVKMECGDVVSTNKIRLVVLPPWWATPWAIAAYILVVIGLVVLSFIFYRRRELKRLQERQEIFASKKEKEVYRQKLNFFTEIAHEIRTPLSLIDMPLEAIEENGLDNPESEHYLKMTRRNTARLLELTSQLLDFQKIESGKLRLKSEAVDIIELLDYTAERFEPSISLKNKTLTKKYVKESLITVTDREAVTKIMSNLLNNALKYAESEISIKLEVSGDTLFIKVVSDGEKIAEADKERIFETFYQTDKSQEQKNGVGIGLPLSRSLAGLLGGELYLESSGDKENVFVLSLPIRQSLESDVPAVSDGHMVSVVYDDDSNQTPLEANGYHVLLVEDNEGIRSMLNDRLASSFLITVASNGKEALAILEKKSVDVVVTDIMMPEMDGLELCRQIKGNPELSHIPVVFITAKNDLESKVKGLQLGAESYIEKPFSIKYLREMVITLLENRRRAREAFARKPFFQAENIPVNREDEKFMEKVLATIKENMGDETFNVEALGDKMCMSRSNLLRHIKAVFNLSPSELIRVVRLKTAAELIKTGGYTLGEISRKIGISSQSYFTKMFFKQFNVMPNEFARQVNEDTRQNGKENNQAEEDSPRDDKPIRRDEAPSNGADKGKVGGQEIND
ncbi:MAG: response regulator [Muribaculaceae bacterium]|nr:response regulator [Muribaculaceae bacterium]